MSALGVRTNWKGPHGRSPSRSSSTGPAAAAHCAIARYEPNPAAVAHSVTSSNDTSEKHRPRESRGSLTSANRRSSNVRSDASDIDSITGTHMAD